MAQQVIDVGNVANDGQGDPLRTAFIKSNENFTELYNIGGITGIANGTSNISIVEDSTVSISSTGVANVFVVSGTGTTTVGTNLTTGIVSATANIVSGGLFVGNGSQLTGVVSSAPAALITGNTLSSNVVTSSLTTVGTLGTVSVTGNVQGGNIRTAGVVSAAGNVQGQNLITGGEIIATGTIAGAGFTTAGEVSATGNITSAGNITASYFIGNGSGLTGFSVSSNAALLTYSVLSSNVTSSSLQAVGTLNFLNISNALGGNGNVSSNNVNAGNQVSATGNVVGGNIITAGTISGATAVISGEITGANITADLTNGNVAGGNVNATNLVAGASVSATGNITGGNINTSGLISTSGNVSATNITGTLTTAAQPNITSVGTLTSVTVTGNITGGNLRTAGSVSATGNVIGANFIGNVVGNISGNISAAGSNTQILFNDSGTANATAGLTFNKTSNVLTVSGTVSGGNVSTGGNLSVTGDTIIGGNLTVSGSTEYINVTSMAIQDPIISIGGGANGAPLSSSDGKDRGEVLQYWATSAKQAFIGYQASTGNIVAATVVTNTNDVITVNTYGNVVVGTVLAQAGVSAVGNVTGANVTTSGLISATGNITGGNILGGANVNATTHTGSTVSVSGNVNGGNIISAALTSTASLSVTGNTATVTSGNYQIGYRDLPQITSFSTLVADAGGKHYYGSGTLTIPASGTTNFAIGTAILVIASGATTISNAGGVTLIQAGTGSTGSRTLAQYGQASIVKVATDTWYISGVGIS